VVTISSCVVSFGFEAIAPVVLSSGRGVIRDAGMFHPVADKFGDILVRFLFECGDEIVEAEAAPRRA